MKNEENNNHKNKPKFKKCAYYRFVKIKYQENNSQEQEINEPKYAIALQMGHNFYITEELIIHSEKGNRVTIKEIYNTIPAGADKSVVHKYKLREYLRLTKQKEKIERKIKELNIEN